mmetsp:Transcript_46620/g.110867  ORF Transcript_46620/g.110867 Transcript_46620/m.110867 type:complete len:281 (-) Transcript_46620:104-946(-)
MGSCCPQALALEAGCWPRWWRSSRRRSRNAPQTSEKSGGGLRLVYHGGLPILAPADEAVQGGLPGYCGLIKRDMLQFGDCSLHIETWPDYRIGAVHWPSGRLLARALAEGALPEVLPSVEGCSVVELGAGPGLPGLVAASLKATSVVLTDYAELVPLAERNVELNGLEASCSAEALDWFGAEASKLSVRSRAAAELPPLDIVLAADVVYVEEQEPLVSALLALMSPGHTQLVLAYKNRTLPDREYLNERILPRLSGLKTGIFGTAEDGETELYVGMLPAL